MKWIKKFEELSPNIYRTAGKQLIQKGHSSRGFNMLDHSLKANHGIGNMWFASEAHGILIKKDDNSDDRYSPKTFSFIESKLTFGEDRLSDMNPETFSDYENFPDHKQSFNIEFYFSPTSNTFRDLNISSLDEVRLFTITFSIDEDKISAIINNIRDSQDSLTYCYYGIFSDRKSATHFTRNILKNEIEKHEDKILDILSLTEIPTEEVIKNVIDLNKSIKVNNLYRSEIPYNISPRESSMSYGTAKNVLYNYFFPKNDITK